MTDDAVYMQDEDDEPTFKLLIQKPHEQTRLHHQGELLGAIDNALVYGVKRDYEDYIIKVHHTAGLMTLMPSSGHKWDWYLSVCKTKNNIVVVERCTKCLDVFTQYGKFC